MNRGNPLTQEEEERYARHLALPSFGMEAQCRLKESSVLCIGAGGLGSPATMYLAAAGVGRIGIVDADTVWVGGKPNRSDHLAGSLSP